MNLEPESFEEKFNKLKNALNTYKALPLNKEAEYSTDKIQPFLDMLQNLDFTGSYEETLTKLFKNFLSLLQGQSLCIFCYDDVLKSYVPQVSEGNMSDVIKSFSYSCNEGFIGRTLLKEKAQIINKFHMDIDDVPLSELYKKMNFSYCMSAPVISNNSKPSVLCLLGGCDENNANTDFEIFKAFNKIIELILGHYNLKQKIALQNRELEKKDFDLYTVYQVSKTLSSILDLEQLLSLIADMLTEVLTVEHVHIYLMNEAESLLKVSGYKYVDPWRSCSFLSFSFTEKIHDWLLTQTPDISIIKNFEEEKLTAAFPDIKEVMNTLETAVLVPMIHKYKLVGFLALGKKYIDDDFQKRDYNFLSTIAPLAANAISNSFLYEMAILDGLTRVFLGRYFQQRCKEEIKRAERYKQIISIVMWDIDHFKKVNDTYGHLVGDIVLKELTSIFKKNHRQGVDLIGRYGGEEFVMLLPDTPREGARIMAERIRTKVNRHNFLNGRIQLTISGGISSYPEDGVNYTELIQQADTYLYAAKRAGRNKILGYGIPEDYTDLKTSQEKASPDPACLAKESLPK